jgi:hypothetical protein
MSLQKHILFYNKVSKISVLEVTADAVRDHRKSFYLTDSNGHVCFTKRKEVQMSSPNEILSQSIKLTNLTGGEG